MAENKNIDENELNELLRRLPLQENSNAINEEAAQFIMAREYDVKPDPKKEQELLRKLQKNTGNSGGYKLYLAFALVMGLSICSTIYFKLKVSQPAAEPKDITLQPNTSLNNQQKNNLQGNEKIGAKTDASVNESARPRDTFGRMTFQRQEIARDSAYSDVKVTSVPESPGAGAELPFITEQDRVKYRKVKSMMLQKLASGDKSLYAHIEADKMQYNGKSFITEAFTLRNMGITNLEYRTFLADQIVQNRKEEYLSARVLTNLWSVYGCSSLANTYFQDEKYNDFPVVNVSLDGAKLYCKWLEDEIKIYFRQNNLKAKPLLVRLPFDYEWIYAARQGFTRVPLEQKYNTIFDDEEGLADKQTYKRINFTRKAVKRKDTLYAISSQNHYGWNEKEMMELYNSGFMYYSAFPADTIYPERIKIFGKIGHVSEIVNEKRSGKIWYIGTSWKSKEDYQKLQNDVKTMSASPFVGFRPVIINTSDPIYKNPWP